jgi:tight adherence protein C
MTAGALCTGAGIAAVVAAVVGILRARAPGRAARDRAGVREPSRARARGSVGRDAAARAVPAPAVATLALVGGGIAALAAVARPAFGGALLSVAVAARIIVVRHRRVEVARRRDGAIPDLVDLFAIAASAGLPVASALPLVAPRAPPALAASVNRAARHVTSGGALGEALADLRRDLGPDGHDLVRALEEGARTGTPLAPVLGAVASTARDRQARRAEERARRLPVTLLFPLVCCTLPAAVLLALVPILVSSIGSLRP